ncbi:ParB/RepB/Spo0J family partition protein [Desulfovibrio inopinatus]|uniref:ParB/RepB/Spo0J family partition protein n=1 Tax=Desulfovibrio inopinatus TaxID=102109 RepID=UPI00041C85F7|nr:ParB/RepB/Spo0J family partition protein [Desulfovibrio inopinatus]
MAGVSKGLGRGLDALLGSSSARQTNDTVRVAPLGHIRPNPNQPRREFSKEALHDLSESIREQGVLQPVLVREVRGAHPVRYEIVAGERRWRASQMAGLEEIPIVVRNVTDEQSLALALIENLQREDLNPMEEAMGLQELISRFSLSQEELSKKIGKSRSAIANTIRLLQLPDAIKEDVASARLSAGHARSLLSVEDTTVREAIWAFIRKENMSVRQVEKIVSNWNKKQELPPEVAASLQNETVTAPVKPSRPAPDVRLRVTAKTLQSGFGVPVSFRGTADKGSITISYKSAEELMTVLSKWGYELQQAEEGSSDESLDDAETNVLEPHEANDANASETSEMLIDESLEEPSDANASEASSDTLTLENDTHASDENDTQALAQPIPDSTTQPTEEGFASAL